MNRLFDLNSLTDIVSNAIGIAILVALVTFLSSVARTYEISVPVGSDTGLAPRFFVCQDDAIWAVDRSEVLRLIAQRGATGSDEASLDSAMELRLESGATTSVELTEQAGFLIHGASAEAWLPMDQIGARATGGAGPFDGIDSEREFAFLFVYADPRDHRTSGSGFDALRRARTELLARGVRVGWTVVSEDHPPHICASPTDAQCAYRPSLP